MANSRPVSNENLFDRMESMRLELKQDIIAAVASVAQNQGRLEAKFDTLEAGRLTRAEANITDLRVLLQKFEGKVDTSEGKISTKLTIIWGIGGGIFVVISEVLLNWATHR